MSHRTCPFVPAALGAILALPIGAQQQDPGTAEFQQRLEATLEKHPFFSKVDYKIDATWQPFVFILQRPPKDDPEYSRIVVNSYLPFLAQLARIHQEQYAKPLALKQSPEMQRYAIAVLASEGDYHNFAKAVDSGSPHMMRAHYDPELRLAVTYQVAFGDADPGDERHALLHEFGHALQHAYSSTGQMTKPSWYNEGLADYRAIDRNVASLLNEPPMQTGHVRTLAFAYANRAGRGLAAPLEELVVPETYAAVIAAASKRAGHDVPPEHALPVFYAQAEMVVRFLHEAEGGKYREGFQRYLAAVQSGKSGLDTFRTAMAIADGKAMADLELAWRRWLTACIREKQSSYPDLAAMTPGAADSELAATLPPPVEFDAGTIAWRPEDIDQRLAAARRLCRDGKYEQALLMLPSEKDVAAGAPAQLLEREKPRIQGLATLRDEVLADCLRSKGTLAVRVANAELKGKVARVEADGVVLQVGKQEQKVPLSAVTPTVLLREGNRLKKFQGTQRWLEMWLRWLDGQPRASMKALVQLGYPSIRELEHDLTADLDASYGSAGTALVALQQLQVSDDNKIAAESITRLRAIVREQGRSPLLQARREAIEQLAKALAERSFALDSAGAFGIAGAAEPQSDGSVLVRYTDPAKVPALDFTPIEGDDELPETTLAYDGPTEVRPVNGTWEAIGAGLMRWPTALSGRQEIEVEFQLVAAGAFLLQLCSDGKSALQVTMDGKVIVIDQKTNKIDEVGAGGQLYAERWHKLRIVHDGKKTLETYFDGERIANVTNVGSRTRGELRLVVYSSNPIGLRNLSIRGKLDPTDPTPIRDRYVARVLADLWPQ